VSRAIPGLSEDGTPRSGLSRWPLSRHPRPLRVLRRPHARAAAAYETGHPGRPDRHDTSPAARQSVVRFRSELRRCGKLPDREQGLFLGSPTGAPRKVQRPRELDPLLRPAAMHGTSRARLVALHQSSKGPHSRQCVMKSRSIALFLPLNSCIGLKWAPGFKRRPQ
jgi:hypothetical protein